MPKKTIGILKQIMECHINDAKTTDLGICARALSEVMPKLEKQEHIMAVEYNRHIGPYTEQMVAVFDDRKASEKEVRDYVCSGESYHPHIVIMYKDQFESLFKGEENGGPKT